MDKRMDKGMDVIVRLSDITTGEDHLHNTYSLWQAGNNLHGDMHAVIDLYK